MSAEGPHTALYRKLVRLLLPADFRKCHQEQLVQVFGDLLMEARARRGLGGRVFVWLREVSALVQLTWRVRRQSWPPRGLERAGTGLLHDLSGDVRYAVRGLAKSPQFATIAVVILGLGIGANTTVFSVIDALYFDDPPHIAAPEDLVQLIEFSTVTQGRDLEILGFEILRGNQEALDDLMAYDQDWRIELSIGGPDGRSYGSGMSVSDNYFDVLGTHPAVGRWFLPEGTEGTQLVAVISHGFWSRAFGSDPSVVGETVELNGHRFTVVGVAPKDFRGASPLEMPPDVWIPFYSTRALTQLPYRSITVRSIGRLRDGVTIEAAQEHLTGVLRGSLLDENREFAEFVEAGVRLHDDVRFPPGSVDLLRDMTRLLMAAVAAVLLIAIANIAILLLARGSVRSGEVALRMAVGAARGRIIRGALTESLVLALLGAAVGIGLAYVASGLVANVLPGTFSVSFQPDVTVLAFACALAIATALLFGMVHVFQTGRADVNRTLKGDEGGADRSKVPGGLVVAQVAVALSLATAAVLTARSLATVSAVPLGYEVDDRILLTVNVDRSDYSEEEGQVFVRRALERLRALPEVRSASTQTSIPFATAVMTMGRPPSPGGGGYPAVVVNSVSPDFFTTMGIEVIAGRAIDETDIIGTVVVSATTARSFWPDQDPVGKVVPGSFWEVVGVVEDTRVNSLSSPPERYVYHFNAPESLGRGRVTFVVHGDAGAGPLREVLRSLDPGIVISSVQTMRDVLGREVAPFRTAALLIGAFGSLALVLAMVGLYGVLSYSVVRARKDIGIRVALGASRRRVGRTVVGRALRLTTFGLLFGVVLMFEGAPVLASLLFETEPRDPGTWAAAVALVIIVAVATSLLPALQAARVDPIEVLRAE